jgi:hypothetical protein
MRIALFFFLLTATGAYAQNSHKEFEGIIIYKTTIVLEDKSLDSNALYKVFGRERQYYFKAGKFKWVPKNVRLDYEIFNPSISTSFIIDKYHSSDTLFYKDMSKIPDTVTSVKNGEQRIILNILCNSASFTVTDKNNSGSEIIRTIYYPADSLLYASAYYNSFQAMGQSFISRYTNSVPLRMELDNKEQSFSIVYEATNIEWKELSDSEFEIDKKLPSKK